MYLARISQEYQELSKRFMTVITEAGFVTNAHVFQMLEVEFMPQLSGKPKKSGPDNWRQQVSERRR